MLVCCGLEHARRGYESFARECFTQLQADPRLKIELVKGSGARGPDELVIPTLRRDRATARRLGRAFRFRPFRLEALSFAITLQPLLARRRPDVVYVSEWDTAHGLVTLRALARQRFKLLLCNGGFAERGFEHIDHVQELTPAARDHVIRLGAESTRHTVLPLGFAIAKEFSPPSLLDIEALRRKWQLPLNRRIVISIAALNRSHKRLDYLIDELARLPEPRPFALFVGEPDAETATLRTYAAARLGSKHHSFLTVAAAEVRELLRASDLFVLASLAEMQGRAVVEAMSEGLLCLVHDSPVLGFAIGEHGLMGDFASPGSLSQLITGTDNGALDPSAPAARHRFVYERFGWDSLHSRYVRFLTGVARGEAANKIVSSSNGEKVSR